MHLADSEVKLLLIHPLCGEILGTSSQNISRGQPCEKGLKKAKFGRKKRCIKLEKKKNKRKQNIQYTT